MFSATMVAVSLGGLLLFPQGFLKSGAYGAIAAVMLAAISSITILPAILGILGKRIDALTFKKLRQTKTNEEIENGFWGKLTRWVMQHPLKVAVPIVAALLLMIIPLTGIKFGGINETYLPPDSPTRVAQAQFDELFPGNRTEPVSTRHRGSRQHHSRSDFQDRKCCAGSGREVHPGGCDEGRCQRPQGRSDGGGTRHVPPSTICDPRTGPRAQLCWSAVLGHRAGQRRRIARSSCR